MHFLSPDTAVIGRRGERDKEPELHVHPQVAAAVIGSAVVGGAISSSGAKSAANTQANAANAATASQRGMFDTTVGLNSPFRQAGVDATSRLSSLLGIGPRGMVGPDGQPIDAITQAYHDYLGADPDAAGLEHQREALASGMSLDQIKQNIADAGAATPHGVYAGQDVADPSFGSLNKPFSLSDFQLDPGIQFQTQQGNLALTNSMAAKDGVLSGGALKALIGYNQGMAGTGYQSAFDRYMAGKNFTLGSLMGVSGLGQNAASNTGNNAAAFSGGIANTITGAGNAQAAGTVGSANALSGAAGGVGNGVFLNSLLNNNAGMGGPVTTSANPGGVFTAPPAQSIA